MPERSFAPPNFDSEMTVTVLGAKRPGAKLYKG